MSIQKKWLICSKAILGLLPTTLIGGSTILWLLRVDLRLSPNVLAVNATARDSQAWDGLLSAPLRYDVQASEESLSPAGVKEQPEPQALAVNAKGSDNVQASDASLSPVGVKEQTHSTHIADQCSQVYMDVGSNIGVQVRKLFEPHLYPKSVVLELFAQYFAPADSRARPSAISGLCAFGFEANPAQQERLRLVESSYAKKGWRTHFFVPNIVSTTSGEDVTLYTNKDGGGVGASAVVKDKGRKQGTKHIVKTLNLGAFLEAEIVPRAKLPGVHTAVVMKMDIEGSEYQVLPYLLKKGLLCQNIIDLMFIEWHARAFPKDKANYHRVTNELLASIEGQTSCVPTRIMKLDDESYAKDGRPFPAV